LTVCRAYWRVLGFNCDEITDRSNFSIRNYRGGKYGRGAGRNGPRVHGNHIDPARRISKVNPHSTLTGHRYLSKFRRSDRACGLLVPTKQPWLSTPEDVNHSGADDNSSIPEPSPALP
jgi:hypothetical protein